jgi:hypothetical protein
MTGLTPGTEHGPFQTKEPHDNGGGVKIDAPPGCYLSGIQLGRDPDGTRWINVWYRDVVAQVL